MVILTRSYSMPTAPCSALRGNGTQGHHSGCRGPQSLVADETIGIYLAALVDGVLRRLLDGHRYGALLRAQVLLVAAHPGAVGDNVTSTSIRSGRYLRYA